MQVYDKPRNLNNVNFESKLERVKYNACLAITDTIQGTNSDSITVGLDLESLLA